VFLRVHVAAIVLGAAIAGAVIASPSWCLVLAAIFAAGATHALLYSASQSLAEAGYMGEAHEAASVAYMSIILAIAATIPQAFFTALPLAGQVGAGLSLASIVSALISATKTFTTIIATFGGHDEEHESAAEDYTHM